MYLVRTAGPPLLRGSRPGAGPWRKLSHEPVGTIHSETGRNDAVTAAVALAGTFGIPVFSRCSHFPMVDFSYHLCWPPGLPGRVRKPWPRRWRRHLTAVRRIAECQDDVFSTLGQHEHYLSIRPEPPTSMARRRRAGCHQRRAGYLPSRPPTNNPDTERLNPADAPIFMLALTSKTLTRARCTIPPQPSWRRSLRRFDGVAGLGWRQFTSGCPRVS